MKELTEHLSERNINLRTQKRLKEKEKDYREYKLSGQEYLMLCGGILLGLMIVSYVFFNTWIPVLVFYVPVFFVARPYEKKRRKLKQQELLEQEFLSAIELLADYLRSGYSVENAVGKSEKELIVLWGEKSDIVREWQGVKGKLSLNKTAEEAFINFGQRSGIRSIKDFSEVFAVVKRSGGNLSDTVRRVSESLSEQFAVEKQIKTLLAAKKMEQKIMSGMPIGILLYIKISSGDLLNVMYMTGMGRVIMSVCLGLYVFAFLWAERIMRIKV